jgi:hypothetical protein
VVAASRLALPNPVAIRNFVISIKPLVVQSDGGWGRETHLFPELRNNDRHESIQCSAQNIILISATLIFMNEKIFSSTENIFLVAQKIISRAATIFCASEKIVSDTQKMVEASQKCF